MAATGDLERAWALAERAETAARTIGDPDEQTRALVNLAKDAEPNHARSLLAQALSVGHWRESVVLLGQIEPAAVVGIINEFDTHK